jgi:hypothetical protein
MRPTLRVKSSLLVLWAVFLALFSYSAAQAQLRPPGMRPPGMNPPGMRPGGINGGGINGGIGGMQIGWRCSKCNYRGEGAIPPKTCPSCGVTFINGMGNGSAGGLMGNPGGRPGMNPGFNPPMNPPNTNPNPPAMNPPPPAFDPPPAFNPPPANNGGFVQSSNTSDVSNVSSSNEMESASKKTLIALVVGIIVVGVSVLLGGTFLVIYLVRNSGSSKSTRRRSRRVEYEY